MFGLDPLYLLNISLFVKKFQFSQNNFENICLGISCNFREQNQGLLTIFSISVNLTILTKDQFWYTQFPEMFQESGILYIYTRIHPYISVYVCLTEPFLSQVILLCIHFLTINTLK